jgi:hypothetical protein
MSSPFKVNQSNFEAVLGFDPGNPSYDMVEDALKLGVSEVQVLRIGDSRVRVVSEPVNPEEPIECIPTSFTFSGYENTSQKMQILVADFIVRGEKYPLIAIAEPNRPIEADEFFRSLVYGGVQYGEIAGSPFAMESLSEKLRVLTTFNTSDYYDEDLQGLSTGNNDYQFLDARTPSPYLGIRFEPSKESLVLQQGLVARSIFNNFAEGQQVPDDYFEYIEVVDICNNGSNIRVETCAKALLPPITVQKIVGEGPEFHAVYNGVVDARTSGGEARASIIVKQGRTLRMHIPSLSSGDVIACSDIGLVEKGRSYATYYLGAFSADKDLITMNILDNLVTSGAMSFYIDFSFSEGLVEVDFDPATSIPSKSLVLEKTVNSIDLYFDSLTSIDTEWVDASN